MIVQTRENKDLVIPKSLGNFVTEGSGGGITPEEAAEIASAVTEEAISEYDTELQVDLEEIREAVSGNTDTLLDLATIAAMGIAERVALFDEIYEKASNGEKIYIRGLVQEETIRTAILPLVSYRPETNPVLHQGGNLYFAAKGDTDNVYFHIGLTSEGSIDPTSGNIIKRNIYNLPTASAEVKGGVRIGSGLTMTQDTISVDTTGLVTDGDLAPFIVQQSANTENIATISAATEAISESLGNYATTAVTGELSTAISGVSESLANYTTTATTDALSAVTSGLAVDIETLSAITSGMVSEQDVIYDYEDIRTSSTAEKQALWNEISSYNNTNKKVWIKQTVSTERHWFLCYSFDAPYLYFVAYTNSTRYLLMFNQNGSITFEQKYLQFAISAGSGVSISNSVVSIKAGYGLGFSGDTLVVSGVSAGPTEYFLNNMSQQELATLYAEISGITEGATDSANIPEILSNYKFFISTEVDGQKWSEAFFSNWEGVWDDELQEHIQVLWITTLKPPKPSYACGVMRSWAQIKPDGSVEFNTDSFDSSSVASASNDITIQLNSAGTITNTDNLGEFSSLARFSKIWFAYNDENVQNSYNTAPLSYFYRKQVGDDLMEYFGCTINIDGTFYKGTWSTPEWGWSSELAADTWTTV